MDKSILNASGCVDMTAHDAISNVTREEKKRNRIKPPADRDEAADILVRTIKEMIWLSGFRLVGRIQFEDPKTGRKYL